MPGVQCLPCRGHIDGWCRSILDCDGEPCVEALERDGLEAGSAVTNITTGPVTMITFATILRAFRGANSAAHPEHCEVVSEAGVLRSSTITLSALQGSAPQSYHKLSLKVMCACGNICLYHCGGGVAEQSISKSGLDGKLARWEYFLGDALYTGSASNSQLRQPLEQIAAIEEHAEAGNVIVSQELLQALESVSPIADVLADGAFRLQHVHYQAPSPGLHMGGGQGEQLASHVAARAAALFRMHVVDNVRQRIEAGHYDFISEIRQLTIMFMGFPSLCDSHARHRSCLQPVQDTVMAVNKVMHKFQGSFVQFRCDEKGFLAICAFGLPGVTHANNAERGILAALQMQVLVELLGQRFACGVTTGDLLCACVGSKIRSEYTMFGDAINLSARLMCKAKQGLATIITDGATFAKTASKANFEALAPLELKGKAQSTKVRMWNLFIFASDVGQAHVQCMSRWVNDGWPALQKSSFILFVSM